MQHVKLGNSGLVIAPLVFGGNVFGWTVDEARSFELLDTFIAAGFNCIDTADVYSRWASGNRGGESEMIIGKWMKQRGTRGKVILATKIGNEMGPDAKGLSRAYILRGVEDSLRRLQTDVIDLYQSHRDDMVTPVEETLEAYAQLIKQGKVRAIGASNFGPKRLSESLAAHEAKGLPRYETLQPHYNLYERSEFEGDLEALCLTESVSVINYYPLASGFLTGKYRSEADLGKSARGGGIKKYLNARGMRILAALDDVARKHSASPAQIALAWLLARPSVTAPIASATTVGQLTEILKSTDIELDAASIAQLDTASAPS